MSPICVGAKNRMSTFFPLGEARIFSCSFVTPSIYRLNRKRNVSTCYIRVLGSTVGHPLVVVKKRLPGFRRPVWVGRNNSWCSLPLLIAYAAHGIANIVDRSSM